MAPLRTRRARGVRRKRWSAAPNACCSVRSGPPPPYSGCCRPGRQRSHVNQYQIPVDLGDVRVVGGEHSVPAGAGRQPWSGGAGDCRRQALTRAELAHQLRGGLVGHAEAGAERVAGDRLAVLVLVLGGGSRQRGRPSRRGRLADGAVLACDQARAARRSIIETATRRSAGPGPGWRPGSAAPGPRAPRPATTAAWQGCRPACRAGARGRPRAVPGTADARMSRAATLRGDARPCGQRDE